MALALWCEDPDKGHAFDEREAIIVYPDGAPQFFCKFHAIWVFAVAFHLADIAGSAGIVVPALGGTFTIMPAGAQPAPDAPVGDGAGQHESPPGVPRPDKAAGKDAASKDAPAMDASTATPGTGRQRHAQAARSGRTIADLIEQRPRSGSRTPASASYGGCP